MCKCTIYLLCVSNDAERVHAMFLSLSQVEVTPLQMREHVGYGPRSGGGMAVRI